MTSKNKKVSYRFEALPFNDCKSFDGYKALPLEMRAGIIVAARNLWELQKENKAVLAQSLDLSLRDVSL